MKKPMTKNVAEQHTNRLLVSISISFVALIALLVINGVQNNGLYLEARSASLIISVICAVIAVGVGVVCAVKKNLFLIEYIAFALVMALCFYCVHGVGFVNARIMKYVTGVLATAYMVLTYFYHTFVPKFINK